MLGYDLCDNLVDHITKYNGSEVSWGGKIVLFRNESGEGGIECM